MRKRPKQDEDDYDLPPVIIGVGSYCIWRETIKKPKVVKIVGFVRPKVKQKTK